MDSKFYKISLEIIDRIEFLVDMGEYEIIKDYLEETKKKLKILKSQTEDKSSNYIDDLIKELK